MPPIEQEEEPRGRIMVVDDTPANLKLLEEILRTQHYEVRAFPRGRLALAAAEREPPELILLDINMPEMNGYEVCRQLKSTPRLADIPVIFISALNETEDKLKGFQSGGQDYISKPFQIEEVQARVETHLKLRRALQAERDLLEKTLNGAVATLLELIQLTSPILVLRSHSIQDIVLWITKKMALDDAWQYELAAMLCLVGCTALPEEVFEKAYGGQRLSPEEDLIFRAHPAVGAGLLSHIPRLETVAEIIRLQHAPDASPSASSSSREGAQILHLAMELDKRIYQNVDCRSALAELKSSGRFKGNLVHLLEDYLPSVARLEVRQIMTRDICSGMILDEDLATIGVKLLIFKAGTVFTHLWIERLRNFEKTHDVPKYIRVRIPSLRGVGKGDT